MTQHSQIILQRFNGLWHGQHVGPLGDTVRDLFGTGILPTPFSTSVPDGVVLAKVQQLNPGVDVVLG